MTALATLIQLHDLDLLREEAHDPIARARLRSLGCGVDGVSHLERTRARLLAGLDRRWLPVYERAQRRYGRGLAVVRERVCLGCYMTLPTSAAPAGGAPMSCESCGRILYWR